MNILIIEDNKKIANNIADVLRLENYTVDVAFTGQQGLDSFFSNSYDLLILDLALPDTDGVDICKEARGENAGLPILMLTARIDLDSKVEGLDSGADDYLTKPFMMDELLARVRALLRRTGDNKQNKINLSKRIEINFSKRKVIKDSKEINLSPIEFRLLEYLTTHRGEVQSASKIYDSVWGSNDGDLLFSDSLKVHIAKLRKKLDPELIKTVKGFGYMIEEDGV